MPTTREGFKAIVDGLDLATTGGQATFKAMMDLQGGFANLVPALESTSAAINQAAIDLASLRKSLADKYAAPNERVRGRQPARSPETPSRRLGSLRLRYSQRVPGGKR